MHSPPAQDTARGSARADLIALAAALAFLAAVVFAGYLLNEAGVPLYAATAPLFGMWRPHAGPGTPAALALAALTIGYGPSLAARLRWPIALAATYLAALAWTFSLAMVDGWRHGIVDRLTAYPEYLHDVPRVTDIGAMLRGFTSHILAFQPGAWTVHVSGHPPGVLLFYVVLDRVGLGGGAAAGLTSLLVGALAAVAVPLTVRSLAGAAKARAMLPFAVLFPGAVCVGVSADGVFMGVVATGVALVACRRGLVGDLAAVLGVRCSGTASS